MKVKFLQDFGSAFFGFKKDSVHDVVNKKEKKKNGRPYTGYELKVGNAHTNAVITVPEYFVTEVKG